jgi:hypothetical protein
LAGEGLAAGGVVVPDRDGLRARGRATVAATAEERVGVSGGGGTEQTRRELWKCAGCGWTNLGQIMNCDGCGERRTTATMSRSVLAGRVDALTEALTAGQEFARAFLSFLEHEAPVEEWDGGSIGYEMGGLADMATEFLAAGLVPGRQDRPGKDSGGASDARGADAEKPA